MSVKRRVASRVYWYAITVAYLIAAFVYIPTLPHDEHLFAAAGTSVFLILYLLPITVFGAKIEATEFGIRVEQYVETNISYSDIRRCYSFYLLPFQVLVVVTNRRPPLKVLFYADSLKEKRRSLTQDGELARLIRSRMVVLRQQPE
jgi:hypothetical protein